MIFILKMRCVESQREEVFEKIFQILGRRQRFVTAVTILELAVGTLASR